MMPALATGLSSRGILSVPIFQQCKLQALLASISVQGTCLPSRFHLIMMWVEYRPSTPADSPSLFKSKQAEIPLNLREAAYQSMASGKLITTSMKMASTTHGAQR